MILIPYASVQYLAREIELQFPSSERARGHRLGRFVAFVTGNRRGQRSGEPAVASGRRFGSLGNRTETTTAQ
jgi:hypothetical protein